MDQLVNTRKMKEFRDRSLEQKGQQDEQLYMQQIFEKEICFKSTQKACTDSAVRRDGGRPIQILRPEKEKERRPNISSLLRGIERNLAWVVRTDLWVGTATHYYTLTLKPMYRRGKGNRYILLTLPLDKEESGLRTCFCVHLHVHSIYYGNNRNRTKRIHLSVSLKDPATFAISLRFPLRFFFI